MENVQYELINNKRITTYFSTPEKNNQSKKIVIMNHGFRGSALGPARQFVDFQRILNKNGFYVLRFDQPNSGNSEGDYLDASFAEWIKTTEYLSNKYLKEWYTVSLMWQSMGATVSVIASNQKSLRGKIPCLLLWVPDAKTTVKVNPDQIYEEDGQKYKGSFWIEAKDLGFFSCLENYQGKIHLVYGEFDKYVEKELIEKTIEITKSKGQEVIILKGQDHSPWEFDLAQKVYFDELKVLINAID